jgi:hypothetical protein
MGRVFPLLATATHTTAARLAELRQGKADEVVDHTAAIPPVAA